MKRIDWVVIAVVALLLVAGGWWWERRERHNAAPIPKPARTAAAKPDAKERICYRGKFTLPGVKATASKGKEGKRMALPDGYVARSGRESVSASATLQVWITGSNSSPELEHYYRGLITWEEWLATGPLFDNVISFAGWSLKTTGCEVPEVENIYAVVVEAPDGTSYLGEMGSEASGFVGKYSATYAVAYTINNLLRGAKHEFDPSGEYPQFGMRDGKLTWGWFGDASTQVESSCAGYTYSDAPYGSETNLGPYVGSVAGSCQIITTGIDAAIWTNVQSNLGAMDLSALVNGCIVGSGSGAVGNSNNGGGSGTPTTYGGAFWYAPPTKITYDLTLTKYDKHTWTGARVVDNVLCLKQYDADGTLRQPNMDYIELPFSQTYEFPIISWDAGQVSGLAALGYHYYTLQTAWREAQDPALPAADVYVPIQAPPVSGGARYAPVQITLAQTIDVHRPDTNRPSDFVSSDASKLTVSEAANETVFTVAAAGATATRTFVTDWVPWITKGGPSWSPNACRRTKHAEGSDVWCWDSHAYLDLTFRSAVAQTLTFTVNWRKVAVSDNYYTGAIRETEWEATTTPGSSTYTVTLTALPDADQTVQVPLLFPNESGPAFLGRVDSVVFSGFTPGAGGPATVTLKGMDLASVTDPDNGGQPIDYYLRVAPGWPVQGGPFPFVNIAHDGASVVLEVPDAYLKSNELTAYGGSPRYVEPSIGHPSGIIQHTQLTLAALIAELDDLEGITATYSAAAADAALEDADGTRLGPENADWLVPLYPHVANATPGVAKDVEACVICRSYGITNGVEYTMKARHALMAAREVLAYEGNAAAGEGIAFEAYYESGGSPVVDPLAAGSTDLAGFCVVAPIPANGERRYAIRQVTS